MLGQLRSQISPCGPHVMWVRMEQNEGEKGGDQITLHEEISGGFEFESVCIGAEDKDKTDIIGYTIIHLFIVKQYKVQ